MFNTLPYNSFPASSEKFNEGKNDVIQAEIDAIKDGTNIDSFGDVETALATKTNLSNIAPTFDAESGVYEIGEQVIYEGVLYEFTSAHSTAGDWDSSEVQAVKISELIDTLKSGLNDLIPASIPVSDVVACWKYKLANNFNFVMFVFEKNIQDSDIINGHTIISGLPHARADIYTTVGTDKGVTIPVIVTTTGNLVVHYPSGSYSGTYRIDATICYYARD